MNKNSSFVYFRCISAMLCFSLTMLLVGCIEKTKKGNFQGGSSPEVSFEQETNDLRNLARKIGVNEESIQNASAQGVIWELREKLENTSSFRGEKLSKEELQVLEDYLSEDTSLLKKIKAYDSFMKKIEGKKIIILQ